MNAFRCRVHAIGHHSNPYFLIPTVLHALTSPAWPLGKFTFEAPDKDDEQCVDIELLACCSSRQPCFKGSHETSRSEERRQVPERGHYISYPYHTLAGQSLSLPPFIYDETRGTERLNKQSPMTYLLRGIASEPRSSGSRVVFLISMVYPWPPP